MDGDEYAKEIDYMEEEEKEDKRIKLSFVDDDKINYLLLNISYNDNLHTEPQRISAWLMNDDPLLLWFIKKYILNIFRWKTSWTGNMNDPEYF